jgi:hypothetical protein
MSSNPNYRELGELGEWKRELTTDKARREDRGQVCGTRVAANGTLSSPRRPSKKNDALQSLAGYIVWGC